MSSHAKRDQIDLALAVMCRLAFVGETFNPYTIASVCGCSHTAIYLIEKQAMNKIRKSWKR